MSSLTGMIEQIRGFDLERALGLRAVTPKVALELDCDEVALVRLKAARRGRPILEVHRVQREDEACVPATLFDTKTVEAGKLADLVVLEKNPLENIRNSESVVYTMVNGRLFDAASMDEIGNHPRKRGSMFWEESED